ncbi:hypothetical protein [Bradyrhizobium sp. SZCCHNR1070]|uniref:hypothetical protein n=1 Tax=Bradyrhizobium sp. SZCCHNR1070 TaxID=3057361 RepID=UPI0029160D13|nr:hypothetical protein [Bradyrhizobium sp. SZCCHNR1070]
MTGKRASARLEEAPPRIALRPRAPVPVPADAKFITARQYCDRLGGISFTTLARMLERDPEMPRPIYFANRIRFFDLAAIEAYERLCEARTAANRNSR